MSLSAMHSSRTEEAAPQKLSDDIRILQNKCVLGGRPKTGKSGHRTMVRVNIVIGAN